SPAIIAVMARDRRRPAGKGHRRGSGAHGWSIRAASAAPLGPNMQSASLEAALAAMDRLDPPLPWQAPPSPPLPLLHPPRRCPPLRPYPPGPPEAGRHVLPPGVSVPFGIDTGPSFIHVTSELLANWDRRLADVAVQGLHNLQIRARAIKPRAVINQAIADVP